jgi:hypothetical protein
METGPVSRKRPDNLDDSIGPTPHTAEPLPPFPGVVDELIYICYRANPSAIAPWLPPGLTPDNAGNVIVTFFREDVAWGFPASKGGFFSPVVNQYPGPDTQEACCLIAGVATEAFQRLFSRHFAPFRPGGSEIRIEGRRISGWMWHDSFGDIARIELEMHEVPPPPNTANDRYLEVGGAGNLVSAIAAVVGKAYVCDLVAFEITDVAAPVMQALRPITHTYQTYVENMACTWGTPERIWQADTGATARRAALLDILDR